MLNQLRNLFKSPKKMEAVLENKSTASKILEQNDELPPQTRPEKVLQHLDFLQKLFNKAFKHHQPVPVND